MIRTFLFYLAVALYGATLALGIHTANTPCVSDDGAGETFCRWQADQQGNGNGGSFVVIFGQVVTLP